MAGSYKHVTTDEGKLSTPKRLSGALDNFGDVYETIEEMFGMIWWFADQLARANGHGDSLLMRTKYVTTAALNYKKGLERSPGSISVEEET